MGRERDNFHNPIHWRNQAVERRFIGTRFANGSVCLGYRPFPPGVSRQEFEQGQTETPVIRVVRGQPQDIAAD